MDKIPMTAAGLSALEVELKQRASSERPRIIAAISEARSHGDLSENAEYHAAKERQGMIVARISFLEQTLSRAEVIDPSKLSGSKVQFGAKVKLANVDSGEEQTFQIVGPEEADIKLGRISVASPLARGLLGREVGDEVKLTMPAGKRTYEILDITYS
jgi:transcription elongation factor GreA